MRTKSVGGGLIDLLTLHNAVPVTVVGPASAYNLCID